MVDQYSNYEWFLKQDVSNYSGKWIAVLDKHIVASDKNITKLLENIKKKYPNKKPIVTKVRDNLSVL